jgi:hypothetical protein
MKICSCCQEYNILLSAARGNGRLPSGNSNGRKMSLQQKANSFMNVPMTPFEDEKKGDAIIWRALQLISYNLA